MHLLSCSKDGSSCVCHLVNTKILGLIITVCEQVSEIHYAGWRVNVDWWHQLTLQKTWHRAKSRHWGWGGSVGPAASCRGDSKCFVSDFTLKIKNGDDIIYLAKLCEGLNVPPDYEDAVDNLVCCAQWVSGKDGKKELFLKLFLSTHSSSLSI